jgi:glycosyltransferase involved in cell wall biosynthesis
MNSSSHPAQRVLMTADTIGGVWTYAVDLCRGLAGHGIHVVLATMGAPVQPRQRADLEALGDAVELHESTFRLEWMDNPWTDVAASGEWLLSLEEACDPDVIHLNGYAHATLPFVAPKLVVAHSCVASWWRAVKQTSLPAHRARYHTAVRLGLDQADLVVAPSQAMLGTLERNYGLSGPSRVIYNGRTPPTPHRFEPPRHHEKHARILSVGRLWDEAKNAAALASVAASLPWPVYLAGDTRPPDGAEQRLPDVHLLGQLSSSQIAAEYRHAAIYALPARYEPFGLSVLEAASAGCALVLGDIPSLRELWDGAAIFVPPNDSAALQAALLFLIDDHHLRCAFGDAAQQRALSYSADRMTAGYLEAYADLLHVPYEPTPAPLVHAFA